MAKIAKYIGCCMGRRFYLIWPPVIVSSTVVPVEQCRLPAIVPMESLGTDGITQRDSVLLIVPVGAIVPVLLAGAHREYIRGTTAAVVLYPEM